MNKLALNTEIVSMRHDIRRARVHTINKLVRTSKKLKNKKGSEKEKEKYQRKATRFMEEIMIMKNLKDDEISKYALTNLRAPDDILNDPKIPLREKVLARLSGHPNIITRVCQFRTKFPSWEEALPTLLEQLGVKKKKKTAKTKTQQKNTPLKVKSENINNNLIGSSDVEEKKNIPSSDAEINTSEASEPKTVKTKRKLKEFEVSDIDVGSSKVKVSGSSKILAEVKRFSEILKSDDDDDNDDDGDEDEVKVSNRDVANSDHNDELEDKTVDPFFVCEDGETGYLTTVKKTNNEDGHHSEKSRKIKQQSSWKRDGHGSFHKKEWKRGQVLKRENLKVKSYQHDDQKFGNRSKISQGQKTARANDREKTENRDNDPIHPSWEAKKRLKNQQHAVSAFQGKKIKFED